MSEKNKKKSGIILSCWIVAALVIFIAFLVNGNTIIGNLKSTDFFEQIFGNTPEFVKNHPDVTPSKSNGLLQVEVESEAIIEPSPTINNIQEQTPPPVAVIPTEPEIPVQPPMETVQNNQTITPKEEVAAVVPPKAPVTPPPAPRSIDLHVYFINIDSDGSINRREITRPTTKLDAPLSAAIQMLLAGPTGTEQSQNLMSLIPSGTRLLSAAVKNGVATLNFSEEFEFNTYGVEGYLGQLMQIVYTATSFSTVDSVQFLIDGQKKDYLGSEGVWIGSPLPRASFK